MDTWAKATPEDRGALFNQTAVTKGISAEIIEKDFWEKRWEKRYLTPFP